MKVGLTARSSRSKRGRAARTERIGVARPDHLIDTRTALVLNDFGTRTATDDRHGHGVVARRSNVYSLNVPVPGEVKRLAAALSPQLAGFERVRERHSLVCKRFETDDYYRISERLRGALAGVPAFEARTTTIESFDAPVRGPGPVVYLAVESPGLRDLHARLVERFGAIADLEGPDYAPHVTLARGGSPERARRLGDHDVRSIEWTVSELAVFDAEHGETVRTVSLPTRA